MKKTTLSLLVFFIYLMNAQQLMCFQNINTNSIVDEKTEWFYIGEMEVTEKEFQILFKSLKEIDGTYFCAKTTQGGRNGCEMKSKDGVIYTYTCTLTGKKTVSILKLKEKNNGK